MKEKEQLGPPMEIAKKKKHYTHPKIETIGDIRDATRGASGNGFDSGGHTFGGTTPSDPYVP